MTTDTPCPTCHEPVGGHTIDGYQECAAGLNYNLPYGDVPGGPLRTPAGDSVMAGEVTVGAGAIDTPLGRIPVLQFRFFSASPTVPMAHIPIRPVILVLDPTGLRNFSAIVARAVSAAIKATK